mgnify:CR=1 FL=1
MNNYEIVLGKDLKIGDVIVHNCHKIIITNVSPGKGAGSIDFGEYISIKAIHPTSWNPFKKNLEFWTYNNCPLVKIEEN